MLVKAAMAATIWAVLASRPQARALSSSVPGPSPFSVKVQVNERVSPPGMVTGVWTVLVWQSAPPVEVLFGGSGEGMVRMAAACPLLATTITALNMLPRAMVVGMAKEVMDS